MCGVCGLVTLPADILLTLANAPDPHDARKGEVLASEPPGPAPASLHKHGHVDAHKPGDN